MTRVDAVVIGMGIAGEEVVEQLLDGGLSVVAVEAGLIGGECKNMLVADADRDVLVGATAAGPAGGEVIGLLTLAVAAQVPLTHLRNMIYAYPTFHRAVEDALRELDRGS